MDKFLEKYNLPWINHEIKKSEQANNKNRMWNFLNTIYPGIKHKM